MSIKYEVVKKAGSHKLSGDADAIAAHNELTDIVNSNDGYVLPEDVLARAEDPYNPLHHHFEWDDEAAAHQHRLKQARNLIQSIEIRPVVEEGADENGNVRAFVSIRQEVINNEGARVDRNVYVPTERAMKDEDTRALVLERIVFEMDAFRRKYDNYTEFAAVFAAIERVKLDLGVEVED